MPYSVDLSVRPQNYVLYRDCHDDCEVYDDASVCKDNTADPSIILLEVIIIWAMSLASSVLICSAPIMIQ